MSNSPLVCYTKISPNRSSPRNHTIDTITIHCMAGNLSVETCGNTFQPIERQASSNYGIDSSGRVGMYVEEKDRSWCTSSGANDNRAVTIEVANDGGASTGWHVSSAAYNTLIKLVADICQRNHIAKLLWRGDKSLIGQISLQNMTVHRWFANKSCPGDYLYNLHGQIANDVNAMLEAPTAPVTPTPINIVNAGDHVKIASNATYYNGKAIPTWVKNKEWIVQEVSNDRAIINESVDGSNHICSPINTAYLTVLKSTSDFSPYRVKITADVLNIRNGPGTNYNINGELRDHGVYTIVEESDNWGHLKSGAGWICLDYTRKI